MRRVQLPGTEISVSRFAFGTASLHHLGAEQVQGQHLRAAADAGLSHFDTAPLYGFGAAERALGAAFGRGHGPQVTIATKVGLYPPGGTRQSRTVMIGRKALGRIFPVLSRAQANWSVERANVSLSGSLKRLRRDHVDLLLLHEPDLDLLASEEWLRWLEAEATQRVAAFGVAGSDAQVAPFLAAAHPLARVVQTKDSLDKREADFLTEAGHTFQLTYGYLSTMPSGANAEAMLAGALARNEKGSVLVSTGNRSRLTTFAAIAEAANRINNH